MVEVAMRPASQVDELNSDTLTRQLKLAAAHQEDWTSINKLLRAMTRPMLEAAVSMRRESLMPYERALSFAAERIVHELREEAPHKDPHYLLGRLDALLDLCDMAIDRSISETVLAQVRSRAYARDILQHLMHQQEIGASDLARLVNVKPNYLSNILAWMESMDLIRRVSTGRAKKISIGPTGEAVFFALAEELKSQTTGKEISEDQHQVASEVQEQLSDRLLSQASSDWATSDQVAAVSSSVGLELALAA